jgi:hypothetical protein
MTRFMNVLAAVALATALTPIAANATTLTSSDYQNTTAQNASSNAVPDVQHVVACHAATAQQSTNDPIVTAGGWGNQRYPESFGG